MPFVVNEIPVNPVNVFEQINSVCSDFRRQLKAGLNPRIEALLDSFDADARETLFRNLMHIDIDFKRRHNVDLISDEYIKRFPEYARIIRQAFYESTMMSMDASVSTPRFSMVDQLADVTMEMPVLAANRLGDYHLIQEVGRGGFGIVYEAKHVQRQNSVALKTLPIGQDHQGMDDAERLHKFRREFRSLADINHPNLIGMQTLEVDGNQWFFTMDLIEGGDFLEYVRRDSELSEQRLRSVLPQLANGIMALHGQRIIHRDLKPSNVLVDKDGKVTILDFGLVVELEQRTDQTLSMQSSRFAGTPLYASPEQIMGNSAAASDWYALGIMLFEALSGQRPFSGTAQEVFDQKRFHDPPNLLDRPDVPQDLAEFTLNLMQTDPDQRPDALEIAKFLSLDTESRSLASIEEELSENLANSDKLLIGRDKQLAQLDGLLQELKSERKPISVFVSGRSGEGKTSLVEEFLQPLRIKTDVLVLSGRCYDRESVPFKAIDSIIDALVAFLRGRTEDEVLEFVPDDIQMLVHLFPIIRRVEAIAKMSQKPIGGLEGKQIRNRAFNALQLLLHTIGNRIPIVIFIDDLQWGDTDSADVLLKMLSDRQPPAIFFIGSYRRDEAAESPFIGRWENQESACPGKTFRPSIAVGPLSEAQCALLVIARVGMDSPEIRQKALELHRSTGGNPYFLDQLIDCFNPETGKFAATPLADVIRMRLEKLPPDAGPLLEIIAVSGHAVPIEEASTAAGLTQSAFSTITHMRSERLVRLIGSDDHQLVDSYHDKIRETVFEQIDSSKRRRLHQKVGETIELRDQIDDKLLSKETLQAGLFSKGPPIPNRVFDLAYHFDAADHHERALVYSILAAEKAKQQYALDIAKKHYEVAERHLADAPQATRFRVRFGHAETHLLSGQYDAAESSFDEAIRSADSQQEKLATRTYLAELIYKSKSLTESVAAYESTLRDLGIRVPQSRLGLATSIAKLYLADRCRRILRFGKSRPPTDWRVGLSIKLLSQLIYPCFFNDQLKAKWSIDMATAQTERYDVSLTAKSICKQHQGTFDSMMSGLRQKKGMNRFEEGRKLAEQIDDVALQANAWWFVGWGSCSSGRLEDAIHALNMAYQIYEQMGDAWRLTYTNNLLAWAHARRGEISNAVKLARASFEQAVRLGQFRLAQSTLEPWSAATCGKLPLADLRNCFELVPDDLSTTIEFKLAEFWWHTANRRSGEALSVAEEAVGIMKQNWIWNDRIAHAVPILAIGIHNHANHLENEGDGQSRPLYRRGLRVAKWAARLSRLHRYTRPSALAALGHAYASIGKTTTGHRWIGKSLLIAEKQGAKFQAAQSLLLCGQLGEKLGRPEAQKQIKKAKLKLAEFDRQIEQVTLEIFGKKFSADHS